MNIAIGTDHGGIELKEYIKSHLENTGYTVKDYGAHSNDPVDYPDYGFAVAEAVASGTCNRGIIICKSGVGMSMVGNKVKGVRAALCLNREMARSSRMHNDANVLVLSAVHTGRKEILEIVELWLSTKFEGGRHQRRIDKITEYEENH